MNGIAVGQVRGFRMQIVGFDDRDDTGFDWKAVIVPEEGEPAIWNGSKWQAVEELTKGEQK